MMDLLLQRPRCTAPLYGVIVVLLGVMATVLGGIEASAAELRVQKGAVTESISGKEISGPRGVTVVRGTPDTSFTGVREIEKPRFVFLEGSGGWILDQRRNRLGQCFDAKTSNVGQYAVRCTWRSLQSFR